MCVCLCGLGSHLMQRDKPASKIKYKHLLHDVRDIECKYGFLECKYRILLL